jgi:hypothetical protein
LSLLIGLGVIIFGISVMGYRAWTRPERPYKQKGIARGSVLGYQFGMGVGILLVIAGLISGIVHLIAG